MPAPLLMLEERIARDRVQPARSVVGSTSDSGLNYAFITVRSCRDRNTPYLLTNATEAEAIHVFERKRVLHGRTESQEEVADHYMLQASMKSRSCEVCSRLNMCTNLRWENCWPDCYFADNGIQAV